jgi:hypothetical protein
MRTYSVEDYLVNQNSLFNFLVEEYGYKLTKQSKFDFNFVSEYIRQDVRINLNYDFKDNFYYFSIIKGARTLFPNDQDDENIKPLIALFQKYEPHIDVNKLMPDDTQYLEALERTASLLKKYGDKVLRGLEWF